MGQPAVAPGLSHGPASRIYDVECVGVAPLAAVGPAEVAAVARRPAEVHREEGYSLLQHELAERQPVAEGLGRGSAVRVDDTRDAGRLVAAAGCRQVERALDAEAVAGIERNSSARREVVRIHDHRHRRGELPGPDSRRGLLGGGQQPQVFRHTLATAQGDHGRRVRQPARGHPHAFEGIDHRGPDACDLGRDRGGDRAGVQAGRIRGDIGRRQGCEGHRPIDSKRSVRTSVVAVAPAPATQRRAVGPQAGPRDPRGLRRGRNGNRLATGWVRIPSRHPARRARAGRT